MSAVSSPQMYAPAPRWHPHIHSLAGAHGVLAEDPGRVRVLDRGFHPLDRLRELAANVDVGRLGADRVGADRAALDQGVRRPAHDLAILERAGSDSSALQQR
jgi:hypothetical protein